jgi:type 1 glutamine amidotransferase
MVQTALILRGGWEGHAPIAATEIFIEHLENAGFITRTETSTAAYEDESLADTDLIVQCVTMSSITRTQVAGLRRAVRAGTGFGGWHGGIVDSFRDNADYQQLVGAQFAAHPPRQAIDLDGSEADNFRTHEVNITELGKSHPITAGITDFSLTTEQYWILHDGLLDVLATTTHPTGAEVPWHRAHVSPAVWTRKWGAGRIFVASPGHDVTTLQDANVRAIIERGLLWAARGARVTI